MGLIGIFKKASNLTKVGAFIFGIASLAYLGNLIIKKDKGIVLKPCITKSVTNDTSSVILFNPSKADQDTLLKRGLTKLDSCKCDANLQLWGGEGISIFGSDGIAKSGGGSTKGEGDDPSNFSESLYLKGLTAQISPNYFIFGDTSNLAFKNKVFDLIPKNNPQSLDSSVIVITDSGIESNNLISYYKNDKLLHGWNFVTDSSNVNYSESNVHGTSVNFLIEKNLAMAKKTDYRILPLVVLGEENKGILFDYLCALSYVNDIKNSNLAKIKVINSSLGYYGFPSLILQNLISKLDSNNILLVSAAGNLADSSDCGMKDKFDMDLRRLKFFPASYSPSSSNVKAITTFIFKDSNNPATYEISYGQKFSDVIVDFAVEPDLIRTENANYFGYFSIGNIFNQSIIEFSTGSSYATPIATAYYYSQLVKFTKNERSIFENLEDPLGILDFPYSLDSLDQFRNKIKGGRILKKVN